MNPNPKRARRQYFKGMRVFTHSRAMATLPYLTHIVRSVRERALELRQLRRQVQLLDARPGQPTRDTLIALEEARTASDRVRAEYEEALLELRSLDILCQDPIRGEVLLPFPHGKQLAWFIFDLFEELPLRTWRYHSDAQDVRRPITELNTIKLG